MAKSFNRVAAGVGVAFAIVVAGGTGVAVASAGPDSSRSSVDQPRDGGHGDGNGSRGHRRGSRDDARPGSGRRGSDRQPASQRTRPGVVANDEPTNATAGRGSAVTAAPIVVVPDVSAAPSGGAGRGSAPSAIGGSTTEIVVPKVIFGNGRSPGPSPAQQTAELPSPAGPAPVVSLTPTALPAPLAPSPGALPQPPQPPPPPLAPESRPWPLAETPVASLWGTVQPSWPAGVFFGLAGLLLAPIAGVWLGQRQARAVEAVSQLVSH